MRRILSPLLVALLLSASGAARAQDDRALMEKAKLLVFDEQWQQALPLLEEGLKRFPGSPFHDSFLFYTAKCREELDQLKPALAAYDEYIRISGNENLKEEAQNSRIHISIELYKLGEKPYIQNVHDLLRSPIKALRYYAAFELSYLGDKSVSAPALPVLEKILAEEKDTELKDRAKLAVLRIDPKRLERAEGRQSSQPSTLRYLRIEIREKFKSESVQIKVPIALADLALHSLDEATKVRMKKEGVNIEGILRQITEGKAGLIFEIRQGEESIKIWVE